MNVVHRLLTQHVDVWTCADTEKKTGRGRSSGNGSSVYGVKKLRELILDLAVRGKLVPQSQKDEPAGELLKRLKAEKENLIAERKIRKGTPLPPVSEQEKNFVLPNGWEWARLGVIGDWGAGATPLRSNSRYYGGAIPWFKSGELTKDFIDSSEETITELALTECSLRLNRPGDVLVAMYGATIGKAAILKVAGTTNQAVCACTPYTGVFNRYLLVLLKALKSNFIGQGAGGAQPNISREKIIATVCALPPPEEQNRIVAKVDELMALCDQLEAQHVSAVDAHEKLVSHLLGTLTQSQNADEFSANWHRIAAHFDTLFTTEASIDALKQTLLQLAMMGKLVPQDLREEPASQLLNRIQFTRTSRRKIVALSEDESQSLINLIPKSWEWASIDQISADESTAITDGPFGANLKTEHYVDHPGYRVIRLQNIGHGEFRDEHKSYIDEARFNNLDKHQVYPGDLVVAGLIDTTMRCCIVPDGIGPALVKADCYRLSVHSLVALKYVFYYLNSPIAQGFAGKYHHGLTLTRIGLGNFRSIPIPIPPLAEQLLIVSIVDELAAICEKLRKRILQADQLQQKLAEVLTEQATSITTAMASVQVKSSDLGFAA